MGNEAMTQTSLLKIGELNAQSQIPVKTIRYYEEIGLIHAAARTEGRFRLFHPDVLSRLAFIKRAQSLGFSLNEIRHILEIHDRGLPPCAEVQAQLDQKLQDIDDRIHQLQTLKQELASLLLRSPLTPSDPHSEDIICPILQPSDHAR